MQSQLFIKRQIQARVERAGLGRFGFLGRLLFDPLFLLLRLGLLFFARLARLRPLPVRDRFVLFITFLIVVALADLNSFSKTGKTGGLL